MLVAISGGCHVEVGQVNGHVDGVGQVNDLLVMLIVLVGIMGDD